MLNLIKLTVVAATLALTVGASAQTYPACRI